MSMTCSCASILASAAVSIAIRCSIWSHSARRLARSGMRASLPKVDLRVNLISCFNMATWDRCVLGQLFGSYITACDQLDLIDYIGSGFTLNRSAMNDKTFRALRAAWIAEIKVRRAQS